LHILVAGLRENYSTNFHKIRWKGRKGGESSWSGPWHLSSTLEVFHVHSYQDQFIQPGSAKGFLCI